MQSFCSGPMALSRAEYLLGTKGVKTSWRAELPSDPWRTSEPSIVGQCRNRRSELCGTGTHCRWPAKQLAVGFMFEREARFARLPAHLENKVLIWIFYLYMPMPIKLRALKNVLQCIGRIHTQLPWAHFQTACKGSLSRYHSTGQSMKHY